MTRSEHMAWCKQRALEYVDTGDCQQAVNSMLSDLNKHDETRGLAEALGMIGLMEAQNGVEATRRWITGFAG